MTDVGSVVKTPATGWFSIDGLARFATKTEADLFAARHGWYTRDQAGPNHRCPACQQEPVPGIPGLMRDIPRGAYVRTEDLLTAQKSRP